MIKYCEKVLFIVLFCTYLSLDKHKVDMQLTKLIIQGTFYNIQVKKYVSSHLLQAFDVLRKSLKLSLTTPQEKVSIICN